MPRQAALLKKTEGERERKRVRERKGERGKKTKRERNRKGVPCFATLINDINC